jgi:hypothetical protein
MCEGFKIFAHFIQVLSFLFFLGTGWLNELGSWITFVNYKKRCTRLAAASDKVYQLLAHGR